jgi:hypothetical protein
MVTRYSARKQASMNGSLRDRDIAVNELVRCSRHTMEKLEDSCRWELPYNDIVPSPPSRRREHPTNPVTEKVRVPQPPSIIRKTRIPLELQMVFLASNRGEKVDKPPTSGAFLCQNWQDPRSNGSKAKKASKKVYLHEEVALNLDISPGLFPERSKAAHFHANEPTYELDNEVEFNVEQPLAPLSKQISSRWESGPRECRDSIGNKMKVLVRDDDESSRRKRRHEPMRCCG